VSTLYPGDRRPRDEIVSAYLKAVARIDRDTNDWATYHVSNLVFSGRFDEAYPLLIEVIRLASDERILCDIGAGDLESLLRFHGEEVIERIEADARAEPNLVAALRCVWDSEVDVRLRSLLAALDDSRDDDSRDDNAGRTPPT
jgi:hypothetical protein